MKTILCDTEISWDESGDGPLLLLVHGLPFQKGMWADIVPFLEPRFRVARIDLPGFGESAVPAKPPSMDVYADILAAFLRERAAAVSLVVGHSLGGYVLLNLATRHPRALDGLVMLDSRAIADEPEQAANRQAIALRLRTESPEFVAEAMLPKMPRKGGVDQALGKRIRERMNPLRADGIAWSQQAIAARPDYSARLGSIHQPALVLTGMHDAIVPLEESGIMAANFHAGRLAVIDDAGHCPMLEKPRQTADALIAWAKGAGFLA